MRSRIPEDTFADALGCCNPRITGAASSRAEDSRGVWVVPLSGWLVTELEGHKERAGGEGFAFANANGKPLNLSSVGRDI